MKPSDVVITILPQADGQLKPRPVLVLSKMPPFDDWLVCGISTRLQHFTVELDEIITTRDPDFRTSGLRADSLIRGGHLMVFPASRFHGRIGTVHGARLQRMLTKLANFLRPEA